MADNLKSRATCWCGTQGEVVSRPRWPMGDGRWDYPLVVDHEGVRHGNVVVRIDDEDGVRFRLVRCES